MKDIKVREVARSTVKTLDRGKLAADKIKESYIKTKELGEANHASPFSYAEEKSEDSGRLAARGMASASGKLNARSCEQALKHIKSRSVSSKTRKESIRKAGSTSSASRAGYRTSGLRSASGTYRQKQRLNAAKRLTVNKAVRTKALEIRGFARMGKAGAIAIAKGVKAAIAGTKALIMLIAAGGWAALCAVIICVMFGAALYIFGDESSESYLPISAEVEAYTPVIQKYANEYGIGEYTELIKAVMMQESGGRGKDPMQSSESGYNKKYPREPNGITDPEYSIKCGVQALASSIKQADVKSPVDVDNIKLCLQGYNCVKCS